MSETAHAGEMRRFHPTGNRSYRAAFASLKQKPLRLRIEEAPRLDARQ